jgi:hypothetical protein
MNNLCEILAKFLCFSSLKISYASDGVENKYDWHGMNLPKVVETRKAVLATYK